MATFIMLTRLSHEGLKSPGALADLSHEVMEHIRKNCPGVAWKASYVVLGPADYVDIFTAPDIETATKVATIIRSEDIRRLFRHLDDHTVASILALKPTIAQLEEAVSRTSGAGDIFAGVRPARGVVENIVELAGTEDEEFDERQ